MAQPMTHIPPTADPIESWIPDDTFGARLALIRTQLRLNVKQVAARAHISDENWRRWERGQSPRDMDVQARRIADSLGVDYVWLLTGVRTGRVSSLFGIDGPPQLELPFPVDRSFCLVPEREPAITC